MLISNFNLYKPEWLELVFHNRNKEYGAFYIRQHYANNLVKAMAVTFVTVVGATLLASNLMGAKAVTEGIVVVKTDPNYFIEPPAIPKVEPPKPKVEKPVEPPARSAAAEIIKTQAFPPPVVTSDLIETDLTRIDDHTAVGPVTIPEGKEGLNSTGGKGDKPGTGLAEGNGTVTGNAPFLSVEKMPEPVYGMDGWTKFLQNTIRYPGAALENGVSGKVFVSFIIEKDGQLSNIKVERGPGYGLNEEAVRVLKLAKAWRPGIQNGQPVRVKLTLPIAFSLDEQ